MDRLQAHRPWSPEPNRKGCLAFPFIVKAVSQSINESVPPCSEALSPSNFLIPGSPFCFCHLTGHLFLSHWTKSGSIWYLKAKPRVQCNTLSVSELWTSMQRIYRVHMNGEMPLLADRGLTKTLQCDGKKPGPNQVRGHYFHYLPQVSVTMVKCHDQRQLGREVLISAHSSTVHHGRKSKQELKAGTQRQDPKHRRMLFPDLLFLTCWPAF